MAFVRGVVTPQPRIGWAETARLIELDLEIYDVWFPGVGSDRPTWLRSGLAVFRTEMFGANLLFRLQTFLHGAGHPGLATTLTRLSRIFFAVTIGRDVRIGGGLYIAHGNIVVEGTTTIGSRASIAPFVTVGLATSAGAAFDVRGPDMGDEVMLGTGAKVLGGVTIGDGARIGANAVVLSDVPADYTAVGIPARALAPKRKRSDLRVFTGGDRS
ncbi:MAG: DapH/DapD/GlmU-related protein [Candidatus Binatia bacterium]|nr:DapH/DapD/GlmU-related protein [Candidatus Binatia bacterium]